MSTPNKETIDAETSPTPTPTKREAAKACKADNECGGELGNMGCKCLNELCNGDQCICDNAKGPLCGAGFTCSDKSLCVASDLKTTSSGARTRNWSVGVAVAVICIVASVVIGAIIKRRRRSSQTPLAGGDMSGPENWS